MNQPCYNSIALARHQHEVDRQEAKEHWIAAAVDRLMDDEIWHLLNNKLDIYEKCALAQKEAEEEYQQHLSAIEQARIDAEVGCE